MHTFRHQSLMYQVVENMSSMARVMDDQDYVIYMNKQMRDEFGNRTGQKCYTLLCGEKKCDECLSLKCRKSKQSEFRDVSIGDKFYRVIASPATVSDKEHYSIEIFHDITEQKLLEIEFMKHYEKLKEDITFAKQIQRKALPEDGVFWNTLSMYSAYLPSEDLGGDLFDIVKIDDENSLFYIADVSGHGVRSSLLTIFLRQVIRGMKTGAADLTALLDELIKSYHDLKLSKELYISVLCGLYNKTTRGLTLINAGHNCPPIVLENYNGEKIKATEINVKGMPICGLLREANHETKTLQMEKGDRILFYTDGVTEAYNRSINRAFGMKGLKKAIKDNENCGGKILVNKIIEEAKGFACTTPIDDMAVVLIEIL